MTWVGEIRDGIKAFLDARKWWQSRNKQSVADRFFQLFESHGVHRNQIPRFIGHNLMLADVQDAVSLTPKLTEAILDDVCERFAVRREWLDGAEPRIYQRHDFYKKAEEFVAFVEALIAKTPEGNLDGVLLWPIENSDDAQAVLVLHELAGYVGDKPVYRYFLCNNWYPTYWKSRAYLTACVASAWKRKVYIHGGKMPAKQIADFASGNVMLGSLTDQWWDPLPGRWNPEDMALKPEEFLKGVDPELDRFGVISGLELWLELDKVGFMDAGFNQLVRPKFEQILAKER